MNNIWTITKKELAAFFNSPVAYIVVGVFLVTTGWLFFSSFFLINQASLRGFFGLCPLLLVIFSPAISMRLIAEERKSGSLELLTTMPLTDTQIIVGKFLAGFLLLGTGFLLTLSYPITITQIGDLDWGPVFGGYVGILFISMTLISIGLLASVWTKNQIVALIIGLVIGFFFLLVDKFTFFLPQGISPLLRFLSIDVHFENFARGVIDTRDVIYYLSLTGIALYLAVYSLRQRRNA